MDSEERAKRYTEQTDDIYRAIGRFTVKFEQLVFFMRQGITSFLSQNGLKNQKLSNIILADQTAYPIKTIFGSMIPEIVNLNEQERRIVKAILKQVQDLIDERNNIIHSTWFVGWAHPDDTDFSNAPGHKLTKGKAGAGVKAFDYTSADFDKFSDKCDSASELIQRLWEVIHLNKRIENNFNISDSGNVTV